MIKVGHYLEWQLAQYFGWRDRVVQIARSIPDGVHRDVEFADMPWATFAEGIEVLRNIRPHSRHRKEVRTKLLQRGVDRWPQQHVTFVMEHFGVLAKDVLMCVEILLQHQDLEAVTVADYFSDSQTRSDVSHCRYTTVRLCRAEALEIETLE